MSRSQTNDLNYRLSKTAIQTTPISSTYNIQNANTKEIWRSKVFDLNKIEQYDMYTVLQFNEEVFHFLKDKYQNSLYMEKCFKKQDKSFMVFECWNERLSEYIAKNPNGLTDKNQVKKILQDVLMSICDIYAQNFMILNLRPDQIVRVECPTEGTLGWKIQSLVFDYTQHDLPSKCEYQFDYGWASNEQKLQREKLQDELKDEQIVWYMGILALRLVYGPKFKLNAKFKDSDLSLSELKQKCHPEVFELIQKSVKANIKDRIPLKSFLNLLVFSNVQITSSIKNKFIYGNMQRIQNSFIIKSSVLQKSSIKRNEFKLLVSSRIQSSQSSKFQQSQKRQNIKEQLLNLKVTQLSEIQAQKLFNELRWMLQKCLYLAQIKDYTQTAASFQQQSVQDKTLIRYFYFKIAQINLTQFKKYLAESAELKSFRQAKSSKELYKELLSCIVQNESQKQRQKKSINMEVIEYEKKMKKLDPKQLKLLTDFQYIAVNLKKSIESQNFNIQQLAEYFSIINGKLFSSLKKGLENAGFQRVQNRGIKVRALCYFILSSYIVLVRPVAQDSSNTLALLFENDFKIYKKKFQDEIRLQGSSHVTFVDDIQYIKLCEFTQKARQQVLVENSQFILKRYFRTVQGDQILEVPLEKESRKRTSLAVSNKFKY